MTNHCLSQWWRRSLTHICVTEPQRVQIFFNLSIFLNPQKTDYLSMPKFQLICVSKMCQWRLKPWTFAGMCLVLYCLYHRHFHYDDVIMTMLASQITSLTVVYSIVYSGVNQRKHQSSASLAFVREIHRGPVNFPHKWPVTRKMFPFDDVIMLWLPQCWWGNPEEYGYSRVPL